jgi:hypothetical protein
MVYILSMTRLDHFRTYFFANLPFVYTSCITGLRGLSNSGYVLTMWNWECHHSQNHKETVDVATKTLSNRSVMLIIFTTTLLFTLSSFPPFHSSFIIEPCNGAINTVYQTHILIITRLTREINTRLITPWTNTLHHCRVVGTDSALFGSSH